MRYMGVGSSENRLTLQPRNPKHIISRQIACSGNNDAKGGVFILELVAVFYALKGVFEANVAEGVFENIQRKHSP